MDEKKDTEVAKLEAQALNEYFTKESRNVTAAKSAYNQSKLESIPPQWRNIISDDPRLMEESLANDFELASFDTEQGMKDRGLLDANGNATKLGEDYLLMEERGLVQNGQITPKGKALTTPKEDILPTDKIANFSSSLDIQDPSVIEAYDLWKTRKDSGIDDEEKDGSAIMNIVKSVPEAVSGMAQIGVSMMRALGPPTIGGPTLAQRGALIGDFLTGATTGAAKGVKLIESELKKSKAFNDKLIEGVTGVKSATSDGLENDPNFIEFEKQTRNAVFDQVTTPALVDSISDTTVGTELFQKAKEDYIAAAGDPVKGEQEFNKAQSGARSGGEMSTDPIGVGLTAATLGGAALFKMANVGRLVKATLAAEAAAIAGKQLPKLEEASTIIAKNIDEASSKVLTLNKSLDDAIKIGDSTAVQSFSNDLNSASTKLNDLKSRAIMLDEGIQVNRTQLQNASTQIEDLNAPSMFGQKVKAGGLKAVENAADALGSAAVLTNKTLRKLERNLGFGRLPWLAHSLGIATGGATYATYAGIRVGSLLAAPLLKKTAQFANVLGEEMLQRTGSSPYWRLVAANEKTGRLGQAFAGLMDYTTPIRRGIASPIKGIAQALPATTLYEAINAQGLDQAAMERSGTAAIVFGPFARLIGGKNDWDTAKVGDFYNFRDKFRVDQAKFQAFEAIPSKSTKQFIASFDAAYPGVYDYNFTKSGDSFFDPTLKIATINVNDTPGMIKALAGHEINHALQFQHQSDSAVRALMLGTDGSKGLVRNADGTFDPEFKAWGDSYNQRMVDSGRAPLNVDDLAIEYYTDVGAQTLFEDVVSGRVFKAAQKTNLRRKVEEVFTKTMEATPIVKNLHFKLGGATDGLGRMVDGSGLLAGGIKELPEVKAMVRKMYKESSGKPQKAQVTPNDSFGKSSNPKHHEAATTIKSLNEQSVKNKTPLPKGILIPDGNGNGVGRIPSDYFATLEESGVIPEGGWGRAIDLNEHMDDAVSYILDYEPTRQGRSTQVDGRTYNNIKPIDWMVSDGRIYLVGMDLNQLKLNITRAAKSDLAKKLNMSMNDIMNDIDVVADLHAKDLTTDDYFKSKDPKNWKRRKNFINATQGLMTEGQMNGNPLFNSLKMNKQTGIYRTFAYDRISRAIRMTATKAVPYGQNSYYNLKANLMPEMSKVNRNGQLVKEKLHGFHGSPQKNITEFQGPTWVAASEDLAKDYAKIYNGEIESNGKVYPVKIDQGKVLKIWQFKDWLDLVNKKAPRNNKLKKAIINTLPDNYFGKPPESDYLLEFGLSEAARLEKAKKHELIVQEWRRKNRNWESFEKETLSERKRLGKDYEFWSDEGTDISASFREGFDPSSANFPSRNKLVDELFNLGYDTLSQKEMGKPTYLVKNPKRIKIYEDKKQEAGRVSTQQGVATYQQAEK